MTSALWIFFGAGKADKHDCAPRGRETAVSSKGAAAIAADAQRSDDALLIERVRSGDVVAFDTLSATYWPQLWRYAYRLLESSDVADDVVQDVLFDCWRRRARLDPTRGVRAYLFTATRHRALELLRHERVVARAEASYPAGDVSGAAQSEGAGAAEFTAAHSTALTEAELTAALDRVLSTLPAARREVLQLRWRHGLSHEEIAQTLGLGVSAVKMQIRRAFVAIRPLLERELRDR